MDISPEGSQYVQRYHVYDFPHIAIIDPRTGRLLWKKEGWTQENPVTAETFAEMAMDFCSRNSFNRPPQAPKPPGAKLTPKQTSFHELSEDEQLQAAMKASIEEAEGPKSEDAAMKPVATEEVVILDDDDEEEEEDDGKPPAGPSFIDALMGVPVAHEPAKGARMQLRMPDGKRIVRKFNPSDPVKIIFAYLAVRIESDSPVALYRLHLN